MYPNISHVEAVYGKPYPSASKSVKHIVDKHNQTLTEILDIAAKMRLNEYINNNYLKNDVDGFTGWRWEKYKVKLVIVSAANRYGGIILCAPRHSGPAMFQNIMAFGGMVFLHNWAGDKNCEQGFVDQYGTFHTREEAYVIAKRNKQIISNKGRGTTPGTLFSEDLY